MLIDIRPEEIKAFDELLKNVECSVTMGYMLVSFRMRIQNGINAEKKKQDIAKAKEILNVKKKN